MNFKKFLIFYISSNNVKLSKKMFFKIIFSSKLCIMQGLKTTQDRVTVKMFMTKEVYDVKQKGGSKK